MRGAGVVQATRNSWVRRMTATEVSSQPSAVRKLAADCAGGSCSRIAHLRLMGQQESSGIQTTPHRKPLADLVVPEWDNPLLDGQDWR